MNRAVICLGNPGREYVRTRHNAGFLFAEQLIAHTHCSSSSFGSSTQQSLISSWDFESSRIFICQPQSFMNRSGEPVRALLQYYKITPSHIVVVHDELDIPLGQLRWKNGGGDAGHNGLKSITRELGTSQYLRLRVGIGRPPPDWGRGGAEHDIVSAWVLGQLTSQESGVFQQVLVAAEDSLKTLLHGATEEGLLAGLPIAQRKLHAWSAVAPAQL